MQQYGKQAFNYRYSADIHFQSDNENQIAKIGQFQKIFEF